MCWYQSRTISSTSSLSSLISSFASPLPMCFLLTSLAIYFTGDSSNSSICFFNHNQDGERTNMGGFYCCFFLLPFFDNGLSRGSMVHSGISVIYIIAEQPAFQWLGASSKLTPLQLETLLTQVNTSRFWLVEFHALSLSACTRASRCFPELSITYSNKNLSFGTVDLGLFPNAAEKFGISLGGGMNQLPTYILFENASEITRFPEWDFEAKPFHAPLKKRFLSRHFELDRCLLEYLNSE